MPLLSVRNVTKRFGGLVANNDVSFDVEVGEIVGVIGPNGAGKSTLFELITGYEPLTRGSISFEGRSIVGLKPHQINRRGIARTFQKTRPFNSLTTLDNVMVGALPHAASHAQALATSARMLELVGLQEKEATPARGLSTGQRKRLEMARAMATRPKLLLLDEVTGGVDQRSIPGLVDLIKKLRDEGLTLLVIEHNMRVITSVSDRIIALHQGEKIADGSPDSVVRDPSVVEAYLGGHFARRA